MWSVCSWPRTTRRRRQKEIQRKRTLRWLPGMDRRTHSHEPFWFLFHFARLRFGIEWDLIELCLVFDLITIISSKTKLFAAQRNVQNIPRSKNSAHFFASRFRIFSNSKSHSIWRGPESKKCRIRRNFATASSHRRILHKLRFFVFVFFFLWLSVVVWLRSSWSSRALACDEMKFPNLII